MLIRHPLRRLVALSVATVLSSASFAQLPQLQLENQAATQQAQQTQQSQPAATGPSDLGSPIRLRQPPQGQVPSTPTPVGAPPKPSKRSEFEIYVQVPRFGSEYVHDLASSGSDASTVVPPDYAVQPGDELIVNIWGSVDADLALIVDRGGRILLPRVGPINVAGVRYADLQDVISRRVAGVFKGFQLSVGLGRVRGVRVYVTGFVERPGAYVLTALSTVANAVMRAGGPSVSGSFRDIQVRRAGAPASSFDFYDLLLRGERRSDKLLQPDDIVYVGPVGVQAAMVGSVNREAIFELKSDETLGHLLQMAGGFSAVADRSRIAIERLDERNSRRVVELPFAKLTETSVRIGDVVRAFSAVNANLSTSTQNKRVTVEGEVLRPGEYVLPAGSTLQEAIKLAGGLSPLAYVYATEFYRESVRLNQQSNYERALRDFEFDLARQAGSQRLSTAEESVALSAQTTNTSRMLDRLRAIKPTGRIVLQLGSAATDLPPLLVEDGDRISVPARFTTVGVFGSVFNTGSYLFSPERTIGSYLQLAGGMTRNAERRSAFVVRANGSVVSAQQTSGTGWFRSGGSIDSIAAEPGDTVFVPTEVDTSTLTQGFKDWTQILYQFGLGVAGLKSLGL